MYAAKAPLLLSANIMKKLWPNLVHLHVIDAFATLLAILLFYLRKSNLLLLIRCI